MKNKAEEKISSIMDVKMFEKDSAKKFNNEKDRIRNTVNYA